MRPRSASLRLTALSMVALLSAAQPRAARAQQAPAEAQMAASDAKIKLAAGVIDREWAGVFAASGDKYTTPDPPLATGPWGAAIEKMNRDAAPGTTPVMFNALGNHGNRRERVAAFQNGLKNGPRRCILGIPAHDAEAVAPSASVNRMKYRCSAKQECT